MNRHPDYETTWAGGYCNGKYQPTVYTDTGRKERTFFERTSKHEMYVMLQQYAKRVHGEEPSLSEILDELNQEKEACKTNGLFQ